MFDAKFRQFEGGIFFVFEDMAFAHKPEYLILFW